MCLSTASSGNERRSYAPRAKFGLVEFSIAFALLYIALLRTRARFMCPLFVLLRNFILSVVVCLCWTARELGPATRTRLHRTTIRLTQRQSIGEVSATELSVSDMLRLARPLLSTHVFRIHPYLPLSTFTSLRHLSRSLPEELHEEITDSHGSLLSFLQAHPTDFRTRRHPDGTWEAKSVAPVIPRLARNIGHKAAADMSSEGLARKGPRIVGRRAPLPDLVAAPAWSHFAINFDRLNFSSLAGHDSPASSSAEGHAISQILSAVSANGLRLVQHPATGVVWVGPQRRSAASCPLTLEPSVEVRASNGTSAVPSYDTFRLARLVACDAFVPLSALEEVGAQYLTAPVCRIALSLPDRFSVELSECDEALLVRPLLSCGLHNSACEGGISEGQLEEPLVSKIGAFQRCLVDAIASNFPPQQHVQMATGVKYISAKVLGRSDKLAAMSIPDIHRYVEEMRVKKRAKRHLSFNADRRAVRRELLIRQNPYGSPYFDDGVVSQFVFDLMQDMPPQTDLTDVLRLVEASGMPVLPLSATFFNRFPQLFVVEENVPGVILLSRRTSADSSAQPVVPFERALAELSMAVSFTVLKHEDPVAVYPTNISFMLRRAVRSSLNHHAGGVTKALESFPQFFTRRQRGDDVLFSSTHALVHAFTQQCCGVSGASGEGVSQRTQ